MLLKNNTGEISKIGYVVIADPKNPQAFIYAPPSSTNILGVITKAVPRYEMCEIATSGTVKVFVFERTVQGSTIRAQKSSDNISRGSCKTAKSTDASYFQIGTALESGKGLINCALSLSYNGSKGGVTNGTYTIGLGLATDGIVTIENGIITSITEAT